jgi:hypothetical protein
VRFGGALLGSGGAWRKLSFRGRCSLVGVIGTLLRLGGGSPCGADPPCPVSGSRLFEAAVVAAVGGMVADGAAVAAVGSVAAAGAAVEDDAGPGCTSGAGVAIVAAGVAIVAAGF